MLKVRNNLKKVTDRLHFKRRLRERYGVNITNKECVEIIKKIRSNEYLDRRVKNTSISRRIYRVPIQGQEVFVVYSRSNKSLVTALTEYMVNKLLEK